MAEQQAEIRHGVLKAWNSGAHTATVQLTGSVGVWLTNVPTDRGIASGDMIVGRKVAVILFDPSNPLDAVVTSVWT